jgi:uncharacterized membrane protein
VFAIAITLLVLEIRLPHETGHGDLLAGLLALWPYYFAFALSFFVILVSWITHHELMRLVRATDHRVQLANGCVLAYITFIPFSTWVLASHLGGPETSTAVTFYCATFVFGNVSFNLLFETIARGGLFRPEVDAERVRGIRRSYRRTGLFYVFAALVALVAPWVALAMNVAVRAYLLHIRYQAQAASREAGTPHLEGTRRIDAFSDGVYAIAITLLILEIRLPHEGAHGSLSAGLRELWPHYFAFALSFFVILVSWMTHHDLMRLVRWTDHRVQLANGCVLAYVTFIPFPTSVLASHLGGPEMATAVTLYCGTFVLGSLAFNLLVTTIERGECFRPEIDGEAVRRIHRGHRLAFFYYLTATLGALVVPWIALAMNVAVRLHLLHIRYQAQHAASRVAASDPPDRTS